MFFHPLNPHMFRSKVMTRDDKFNRIRMNSERLSQLQKVLAKDPTDVAALLDVERTVEEQVKLSSELNYPGPIGVE